MTDGVGYRLVPRGLIAWTEAAMSRGGLRTETVAAVNRAVINACTANPESLVSGAPNRVPGTMIWWTAVVDHEQRVITVTDIDPPPRGEL